MGNTYGCDAKIVRADPDLLATPVFEQRFRRRIERENSQALEIPKRLLKELIGSIQTDLGPARFGLPDNVQSSAYDFLHDNHGDELLVSRNRGSAFAVIATLQQDAGQYIRIEGDHVSRSASRS